MSLTVRSTAAAALLVVPVAVELAAPDLVEAAAGHVLFAVSQLAGWLLVASVVRDAAGPARRGARLGRRAVLVACALQVLFAVVYGVTALDAEPLEASFVLFGLGFLALTVGGLAWGVGLLRSGCRLAGSAVVTVAGTGLLAIGVGDTVLHDVFLLSSYAAWAVVGVGLTRTATPRRDPDGSPAPASVG